MLAMLFMTGCETANLPEAELTDLKNQIASIKQQYESMQKTLDLLKQTDNELKAAIQELKTSGADNQTLVEMQNKQKELEEQIKNVEALLNSTKDWATSTFATLEQQKKLSETLAELAIKVELLEGGVSGGGEVSLDALVEACINSLKSWINDQLAGYCTLAQAQASLESMQTSVTNGDKALQGEIDALEKELEEMEARLTEAYKKAIEEAVKNNGTLPSTPDLGDANEDLNAWLSQVNSKITELESRIDAIEEQLAALVSRVQSIQCLTFDSEFIKDYPFQNSDDYMRYSCFISPKSVVEELAKNYKSTMTMHFVEYKSERYGDGEDDFNYVPVNVYDIPFSACKADPQKGLLTLDLSIKDIPEEFFIKGEMNVSYYTTMICISDGNTMIHADQQELYCEYDYDTYPTYDYPGNGGSIYLSKKGLTWTLDKEEYGITADDEIIAVGTSVEIDINSDWMKLSWNEDTDDITVSVEDNDSGEPRSSYVYILTKNKKIRIDYRQFCDDGVLDASKTELVFSYDEWYDEGVYEWRGLSEMITVSKKENTYLSVIDEYDWISVDYYSGSYDSEGESEVYIRVNRQVEPSDVPFREGVITIMDGRGNSVDIKVTQNLLTRDALTIKADEQEVNFTYEGGMKTITLTHPENIEIEFEEDSKFIELDITAVNETTSVLVIYANENYSDEREASVFLYLDVNMYEIPITEIKVKQAAGR